MSNESDYATCDCGCERRFKPSGGGGNAQRFATEECRMRWHRSHTRKILDLRPRAKRLHRGTEFQLPPEYLEFIDTFGDITDAPNRSAALMHIIDSARMDTMALLELILKWIISTDTITVVDTPTSDR